MEHKLCVLIDFENIAAGTEKEGLGRFDIRAVVRRLKDKGRILVNRSYGDWGRYAKFKQRLLEQGVTMVELTSYRGQDKNRADIALVVDAMEIAFTRDYIDTFVLMSGDSDFTPVVMRLKELDRRVIGIGTRGSSSRLLVDSCDEFIFYESLIKQARREEKPKRDGDRRNNEADADADVEVSDSTNALSKEDAFALLAETLSGIQKDDPGPVQGGLIKQSMLRKEPSFDETEYGYSGFARFLEAARGRKIVSLHRDQKAGGYRVDLVSADSPVETATEEVAAVARDAEVSVVEPVVEESKLTGLAGKMAKALAGQSITVVSHMVRHTVVHELVDHVQERERRRKRNTLQYVYGDIARRCRKTDPFVEPGKVKSVIDSIKTAGLLKHTSGGPVRSQNAHFVLRHDADEILVALRRLYVDTLLSLDWDLDDNEALSELLWNDTDHGPEAGELVTLLLEDYEEVEVDDDDDDDAEYEDEPEEVPAVVDEGPIEE